MNYYGNIIQENLEYHNLKIKDLAELTETSKKHISEIISGKANPSYEFTLKLERVFGIPENTLFVASLRLQELKILENDKDLNSIYEKLKNEPENKLLYRGNALKNISQTFRGSLNTFKAYLKSASVDFFKYKDEPMAYYWIAKMDRRFGNLKSLGQFKKSTGNTVIKNVLDIFYGSKDIYKRIDEVISYLDSKGIILRNSPFMSGSNVNGCVLKKDKQYFIFMNDKQKREYQYIFALMHELMHIYKDHDDDNNKVAQLIREYESKYNKKHKELNLAMNIFESEELMEMKWELLRSQTKLRIKFEE